MERGWGYWRLQLQTSPAEFGKVRAEESSKNSSESPAFSQFLMAPPNCVH